MKALMVVGTTSYAGKSLITAALCRILHKQGWRVTPFKGQNMSLNAYVTSNGAEIAYAQAVQAWASGILPRVEMNPILLKPQGDMTSQVILNGNVQGQVGAEEYYEQFFDRGWQEIQRSLNYLTANYDIIVCEGAGSPAEINLKHRDLTNMRVAKYLNAHTILVVDIERGGAFAHVVGTLELLEPEERALIKGIIINKFRGRRSLLDSGITWLENRVGIPVIGVIPWLDHAFPSEDSLDLWERRNDKSGSDLTITVIRLPRISNFTDFDPLAAEPSVNLKYLGLRDTLGRPDAVIIPGTKTTISDLLAMQKTHLAAQIRDYVLSGGILLGICGGFQMMGETIADPEGTEGLEGRFTGLQLLPLKTTISGTKITRQRQVYSLYPQTGLPISGYEIHQGRTTPISGGTKNPPLTMMPLFDDGTLGMVDSSQCLWGTYLHGIFENGCWRRAWLNRLRQQRGLKSLPTGIPNFQEQREASLDILVNTIEANIDLMRVMPR